MKDYEIDTDGRVVWVNGPVLLGRFSQRGIDVHVDGKCVGDSCSGTWKANIEDWRRFQSLMVEIHNIEVPDKHMPGFLK